MPLGWAIGMELLTLLFPQLLCKLHSFQDIILSGQSLEITWNKVKKEKVRTRGCVLSQPDSQGVQTKENIKLP